MSFYLEPKMSDIELIDALKFHFPIYVQNAFASAQLSTVQNAIDLLKRLEIIGSSENNGGKTPPLLHRITSTKPTEMGIIRKVIITIGTIAGIRKPRLNT
jgi:hypothetical protein